MRYIAVGRIVWDNEAREVVDRYGDHITAERMAAKANLRDQEWREVTNIALRRTV